MNAPVDIAAYLQQHETKGLLRFITCGSVDDGKSTLIGRLLHDTKRLFDDQLRALAADSRRHGTQGEAIDFALLVDGLAAEREQGITIDVAYRFFDTDRRKFIVADCPGHEQYTRNMATGASTADLAVVLVDARKGLLTQTRRHSYIVSLLGIRHVVLAVNKMDAAGYDQATFERIVADYAALATSLGITRVQAIPLSALRGDNLLALKALEVEFASKAKCVFIDPLCNTGSAFEQYDDGVEHSIWLGLMRDRLELTHSFRKNNTRCVLFWMRSRFNTQCVAKLLWAVMCGRACSTPACHGRIAALC